MEDPARRATDAVDAYRNHFTGRVGPAARSVANRQARTPTEEQNLVNIRGPYLQALDIPNWSDESWESFASRVGLNPLIRKAFSDLGFRRLYDFQERSVEAISDGHDTVVTAATGRGKTEAWLLPILDRILEKKRHGEADGTTATLIYPTKALAQDQFKRLVQYLYRINEQWPSNQQITIGIYDGDTPTNVGSKAQGYLQSSFKYFDCPGANDDLEKCRNCGQGVHVHHGGQAYELRPEKRQCTDDVPLDFIRLTKHAILTEGVDILLTNPDTINMKLVNVNAPDEHETFIYDPEFLVFDEVHTYDGLFGSYTATLTKRLRALRANRDCDPLQVIASSATVDNDVELFRRISGAREVAHVDEQPRTLDRPDTTTVPPAFVETTLSESDFLAFARGRRTPPLLEAVEFDVDAETFDDDRLLDMLADELFDHFTAEEDDKGSDSVVSLVREVHGELREEPRQYDAFRAWLADEYDLSTDDADRLLENFVALGTFSGLLENRTHLFSWPVDGFYSCAACDAVYSAPRETCAACDYGFVTRSAHCSRCDDEALVAWYCPSCEQLEPYVPSEEGEHQWDDSHACQRCLATREEEIQSLRVTFQPTLECTACETRSTRTTATDCPDCTADMVHLTPDQYQCPNPACETTRPYESDCPSCGDDQRPVTGSGTVDCPACGRSYDGAPADGCECGRRLLQTRFVPWVCRNDECDREFFDAPPDTCHCGSYTFARAGLFEVFTDTYCEGCETSGVDGPACDCEDATRRTREGAHRAYQTLQPDGSVRPVSSISAVAPCTHQGLNYDPSRRYDELVRGPGNLAVTSSQYMLRRVADEEGYEAAKLLSFADSHRDMKELDRDFTEPEVATVLDQTLIESLREHGPWTPADTVIEGAFARIDALSEELSPPQDVRGLTFDLTTELVDTARRHMDAREAIRDRLRRRLYPHPYSQRYGEFEGALADDGLVDVRLAPETRDALDEDEHAVLRAVIDDGGGGPLDDIAPPGPGTSVRDLVGGLDSDGVLALDGDYVTLAPEALEVTLSGEEDGLRYRPETSRFERTLEAQFGVTSGAGVPFETPLAEQADPTHPRFSSRAYRTTYSQARVLVSQVYHGLTDKKERRELEYLFREGNHPHFLSSGPTMELGVDIGELDALLLYGTPPNMNAYLQRIGRAGRSSNASLVHSVSQRNPIDYYYYEQPGDLMAADPQPVPLKEYNEEVLRVSLTWAVLDYVAANFVVPWEVEGYGPYKSVSGGDEFDRRQPSTEDEAAKFTHVMSARTKELGLSSRNSKLAALGTLVHDYRREIRGHLETLLDHSYCESCSRKYGRDDAGTSCAEPDCSGEIRSAQADFGHLAEEAVDGFEERFITQYADYRDRLTEELETVQGRLNHLRRERRRASSAEEGRRIAAERSALEERKQALQDRLDRIENMEYLDFLRESRQSRYAFNMRSVTNNVGLTLIDEGEDGYESRSAGDDDGRSMRMAISELHPGAAYLDKGDVYVVSRVRTDDFASSELREQVRGSGVDELADEYVCRACGAAATDPNAACDCSGEAGRERRRLVAPDSVRAHRSDLRMAAEGDPARAVYGEASETIQNTYAERQTDILAFEARHTHEFSGPDGEQLGRVMYGDMDVLLHTDSYRAKYKSGEIDAEETPFRICGVDDCTGIVYEGDDEQFRCSADTDHRPGGDDGFELVRLGYRYGTEGIRADLTDTAQAHTLVHGFRVALQYLGGVSIRELSEVVHDDGVVDLFDAQEGGAGVTRLLFEAGPGGQDTLRQAINLLQKHFQCDCEDGCPLCLYQYGCDTHNRGSTFDREGLFERLDAADAGETPVVGDGGIASSAGGEQDEHTTETSIGEETTTNTTDTDT